MTQRTCSVCGAPSTLPASVGLCVPCAEIAADYTAAAVEERALMLPHGARRTILERVAAWLRASPAPPPPQKP